MKSKILIPITIVLLLILATVLYFGVLNKKTKNNNDIPESTTTTTTKEIKKLKIVNPETKSRPFAIMINNHPTARKLHSGLQDAYIIYEFIVEGGITRYMALYLDQTTERIGSVRSARHYYLDYALENDAIYVHHGYSPQAYSDFKELNISRIEINESTTGWRDKELRQSGIAYEHTLYTSIAKLNNGLKNIRTERNNNLLLNYSIDSVSLIDKENAIEAKNVTIKYSASVKNTFEYDDDNKVYKRFVNSKAHTDYVTKEQYTFKNIITYQVSNKTIKQDEKGRQELSNIGSGTGYYISEGVAVPITWEKTSRSSQTIYKFANGEKLIVNDGNTFIEVQPKGQELTIN